MRSRRRKFTSLALISAFVLGAAGVAAAPVGADVGAHDASASRSARPSSVRWVRFDGHRLFVRDYPGRGPALVLMHGFPDNVHLYDRLVPHLRGRRTITFDFLGWGRSDKPRGHVYTFAEQEAELEAVVSQLHLASVVPVAHDASGPAAINWSLAHASQVAALVLLNTFYNPMPTTNPPEAIRIFSEPAFDELARAVATDQRISRWLFYWQVGRFMSSPKIRSAMLRELWPEFLPSIPAFASLNRDLLPASAANAAHVPDLNAFQRPVRIVFGARDPYLNRGMAEAFHQMLPTSDLFLLPARHYVQVDAPARVASLLKTVPLAT
jgi:haloalkane dehalogenase